MKAYELDSRDANIPLNKTAGRFYFEKFINNYHHYNHPNHYKKDLYKKLFGFSGNLSLEDKKEIFKTFVCIVNLETNNYCNRTCHYCPLNIFDRKSQNNLISDYLFIKILDELKSIDYNSTICLNLYNEPLSDGAIFERLRMIKSYVPNSFLRFNSNGDFITYKTIQRLESSGLDSINITLHTTKADSYNDTWAKNTIAKFYKKLDLEPSTYELHPDYAINSSYQFGKLNLLVSTINWGKYGNDRGGVLRDLSVDSRKNPCVKIFREFSIDYRGLVFPCCNIFPDDRDNEKYIFGDLKIDNMFDIYSKDIWAKWRKSLFIYSSKKSPCDTCKDGYFDECSKDDYSGNSKILEQLEILYNDKN